MFWTRVGHPKFTILKKHKIEEYYEANINTT